MRPGRGGANDDYVGICHWHSQLPFPQVLASASEYAARPGSCRKPPSALYVGRWRGVWVPLSFFVSGPMRLWMQPQNEKFFALVSKGRLEGRRVSVVRCCSTRMATCPTMPSERGAARRRCSPNGPHPGMCNPDDETPCVDREPSEEGEHGDARLHGQRNHDALNTVLRVCCEVSRDIVVSGMGCYRDGCALRGVRG